MLDSQLLRDFLGAEILEVVRSVGFDRIAVVGRTENMVMEAIVELHVQGKTGGYWSCLAVDSWVGIDYDAVDGSYVHKHSVACCSADGDRPKLGMPWRSSAVLPPQLYTDKQITPIL